MSTEPNVNFYEFSIWRDDKTKTLGSGYQKHYVHERYTSGCGYADGKVFLERFRGRVFVFSGFWDHCSEGQILMFNEKNKLLSIISKSSLKVSQNFKCTDQVDNKVPE